MVDASVSGAPPHRTRRPDRLSSNAHGTRAVLCCLFSGDDDDDHQLEEMPKRVAVIGAGYIAVEMAGIFNSLGADTKLFTRGSTPLRWADTLIVDVRRALCLVVVVVVAARRLVAGASARGSRTRLSPPPRRGAEKRWEPPPQSRASSSPARRAHSLPVLAPPLTRAWCVLGFLLFRNRRSSARWTARGSRSCRTRRRPPSPRTRRRAS